MAIQMIFCLETNRRAATDYIYMREVLDHFYLIDNQVKISPIYMGTKSKYQSNSVSREIKKKTQEYRHGETKVIYCIDTDQYENTSKHANEFRDIGQFCEKNNYEMIWFCHDIEEVFVGKKIADSQKVQTAKAFRRNKEIEKVSQERLSEEKLKTRASNILCILDQYLDRK